VTDDGMVRQLGERRRADGTETTTLFQLEGAAALLYEGPACRIAIASALDPADEAAAAATVDDLATEIADGELVIDVAGVALEGQGIASAATAGDRAAARALVIRGDLDEVLGERVGLVRRWVNSTFAVFALEPRECPAGS
jgi:ABC-type proline/glycine betaine transport system substrate-binding protein